MLFKAKMFKRQLHAIYRMAQQNEPLFFEMEKEKYFISANV